MICDRCGKSGCTIDFCAECAVAMVYPAVDIHAEKVSDARFPVLSDGERTVGIEIEGNWNVESAIKLAQNENITTKRDGSLRGLEAIEAVSPVLTTSTYQKWLKALPLEGISTYDRAGIHVWVGTPDYSWQDINKLLIWATYWQDAIEKMVPESRRLSTSRDLSGRPMKIGWIPHAYRTKKGFLRSLYGTNRLKSEAGAMSRMHESKRANDNGGMPYAGPVNRTWWLNIHGHYTERKAIEIRLLHATKERWVIDAWLDYWVGVVNDLKAVHVDDVKLVSPACFMRPASWVFFDEEAKRTYNKTRLRFSQHEDMVNAMKKTDKGVKDVRDLWHSRNH